MSFPSYLPVRSDLPFYALRSPLSAYAEDHACVPEIMGERQLIMALRRAGTGFARRAPSLIVGVLYHFLLIWVIRPCPDSPSLGSAELLIILGKSSKLLLKYTRDPTP